MQAVRESGFSDGADIFWYYIDIGIADILSVTIHFWCTIPIVRTCCRVRFTESLYNLLFM